MTLSKVLLADKVKKTHTIEYENININTDTINKINAFFNNKSEVILYNINDNTCDTYNYDVSILIKIYNAELKVPTNEQFYLYYNINSNNLTENERLLLDKVISKIRKRISTCEDLIPLYDIRSNNIYLIHSENVFTRIMYDDYRAVSKSYLIKLKEKYENRANYDKKISLHSPEKIKKQIDFLNNFNLEKLKSTFYKIYYTQSNQAGKDLTLCVRPSFINIFKHIKPYYTRSEVINLALNMGIIIPDDTYYNSQKVINLCDFIRSNDISYEILVRHQKYIYENKLVHLIQYYSLNGSYFINKYLRNLHNKEHKNALLETIIHKMYDIIKNAPALDKSYILYRFVDTDSYLSNLKIGDIYIEKGFLSATRDPFYRSDYYKFGFVLIKIKIPSNIKGVGLCIEPYSHFSEEQEVILPAMSKLKLVNVNNDAVYYHIDNQYETKITRKYEFEYLGCNNIEFNNYLPLNTYNDIPVDLLDLKFTKNNLKDKIEEFYKKYTNTINQFNVYIGDKLLTIIMEFYDSTSVYKNYYAYANKNGVCFYTFYENTLLFFLEIVEPLNQLYVNYYFRHSDNSLLHKLISEEDFIIFLSKLSYAFGISNVVLYSEYNFCYNVMKGEHKDISLGYNYCVDYYVFFKYGTKKYTKIKEIEPKFDYLQLEYVKNYKISDILRKHDKDELFQIMEQNNFTNKTMGQFYVYIVENYCFLIKTLEDKVIRIYNTEYKIASNPFLYDYYIFNSYKVLYDRNIIFYLPPIFEPHKYITIDNNDIDNNRKNKYRL